MTGDSRPSIVTVVRGGDVRATTFPRETTAVRTARVRTASTGVGAVRTLAATPSAAMTASSSSWALIPAMAAATASRSASSR